MHRSLLAVLSAGLLLVVVGCSSSPAATQPPGGVTPPPGGVATPTHAAGAPTPPPGGATGTECAAIPTFSLTNPIPPSFTPDTTLESHFPAAVDGTPASEVTSEFWVQMLCMYGGQTVVDQSRGSMGSGVNLANMSFGSAKYTVDGESTTLSAFRTPGTDANVLATSLAQLAALSGGTGIQGTLGTANVSGKTVYVSTDATDGTKTYAYVSGDTMIFTETLTDSQAAKIFAAIP